MGKITRPILSEVFPRKRLFEALDKLRYLVIGVSGPGGCGKTTLVGSYLEGPKISRFWYQVEEGDKDPAIFFYYLGQAAQNPLPKEKTPSPYLPGSSPKAIPPLPGVISKNCSPG